ncbi:MAG: phage tail protein [Myxococcota bacterium]|nr:phage tail protein [Myxococcota bacterium]
MSSWVGRGGGRSSSQPTLSDSTAADGDSGANPPAWQGRGGGRYRSQPSLAPSDSHQGDHGASQSGWQGRGGGRYRPQININWAQAHYGDEGAAQLDWQGRGGGRHRPQPNIQESTSHTGDLGASQSGWAGRGGGRHRPQPVIEASTSHIGDEGAAANGWKGRGGGRHRPQPRIRPALLMGLQRGAMNAVSGAVAALGSQLGMGFAARALEDPLGSYVFSLEINGVEIAHFQDCSGIKSATEVFEIKEGGVNHAALKLPGQSTWDNLVLSYGVTSDASMLSLRELILNDNYDVPSEVSFDTVKLGGSVSNALSSLMQKTGGAKQPKRFNGSIVIRNNRFREMVRYNFQDAWIVSWEGPKIDSAGSTLAVSKVEIAHHGITVS